VTGLVAQRHAGKFPLWLAPDQVRVITLGAEDEEGIGGGYRGGDSQAKGVNESERGCLRQHPVAGKLFNWPARFPLNTDGALAVSYPLPAAVNTLRGS